MGPSWNLRGTFVDLRGPSWNLRGTFMDLRGPSWNLRGTPVGTFFGKKHETATKPQKSTKFQEKLLKRVFCVKSFVFPLMQGESSKIAWAKVLCHDLALKRLWCTKCCRISAAKQKSPQILTKQPQQHCNHLEIFIFFTMWVALAVPAACAFVSGHFLNSWVGCFKNRKGHLASTSGYQDKSCFSRTNLAILPPSVHAPPQR